MARYSVRLAIVGVQHPVYPRGNYNCGQNPVFAHCIRDALKTKAEDNCYGCVIAQPGASSNVIRCREGRRWNGRSNRPRPFRREEHRCG